MGRRRRKVVHVPRRRLPKIFSCPQCGKEAVRVEISRDRNLALVSCAGCGIRKEFHLKPSQREIDVYCMFTDKVYGG